MTEPVRAEAVEPLSGKPVNILAVTRDTLSATDFSLSAPAAQMDLTDASPKSTPDLVKTSRMIASAIKETEIVGPGASACVTIGRDDDGDANARLCIKKDKSVLFTMKM